MKMCSKLTGEHPSEGRFNKVAFTGSSWLENPTYLKDSKSAKVSTTN